MRPESPRTPSISVRDLGKRYGAVEAVHAMSFDVEEGEIFGLLGPNGAGKTTALECVIGLREPDRGSIAICGLDARRHPRQAKRRVGAALQETALQDRITPREAIGLFAALYGAAPAVDALLERFGLREKADAPFDTLSGGQRQRLALALALVNEPRAIVLDEPTAGLDAHARRELHAAIRRLRQDGVGVLLSTHDLDEAQQLCDRVAVMHRGRVAAVGPPAALIASSGLTHAVTLHTSEPVPRELLIALPDVTEVACEGTTARFRTPHPGRTLAALSAALEARGIAIDELHVQRATLEELFLQLTS